MEEYLKKPTPEAIGARPCQPNSYGLEPAAMVRGLEMRLGPICRLFERFGQETGEVPQLILAH